MVPIINISQDFDDGNAALRQPWSARIIAIHRIWFDDWRYGEQHSAREICERFVSDPKIARYTGGELPYPFLVDAGGVVTQALTIGDIGKHAAVWNSEALGVGIIGDFRKHGILHRQLDSVIELCAELCAAHGIQPLRTISVDLRNGKTATAFGVSGHDELPGATHSPDKQCPGKYIGMNNLRFSIGEEMIRAARARLVYSGVAVEPICSSPS